MANVPESTSYDGGIYQLETVDEVLGGVNGKANAQAKGLANRTNWLKQQVDALNVLKNKGIAAFSAANSYLGGEQVIYDANIWVANTSITPGAWNASQWTIQFPTAATGTSDKKVATTEFVANASALTVPRDSSTGAAQLPSGTLAQRPANGAGKLRYNSDTSRFEGNNGTAWGSLGGATGGGTDAVFYLNDQTINNDYTIPASQNAMTAGPITVANGKTVTVSSGSTWTVV